MENNNKSCRHCFYLRRKVEAPAYYCENTNKTIIDADNRAACKNFTNNGDKR